MMYYVICNMYIYNRQITVHINTHDWLVFNRICKHRMHDSTMTDKRESNEMILMISRNGGITFNGGFHGHGGTPKWLVFIRENSHLKWMITGGSPIFSDTSINHHCKHEITMSDPSQTPMNP